MSFDDWGLALHLLSAFALVAGITFFWILIVAVRRLDTAGETGRMAPANKIAEICVRLGAGGTIAFGIWLAFSVGGYDILDGWIIAAFALWAIVMALSSRASAAHNRAVDKARALQATDEAATPNAELLALNRTSAVVFLQALT